MLSEQQIAALKYLVFKSSDANPLAKRMLAALLDRSAGLTRPVQFDFQDGFQGFSREELAAAFQGLHDVQSCLGATHFGALLKAAGESEARLWSVFGNGRWQCGLWIEGRRSGITVPVSRAELELIEITDEVLYPHQGKTSKAA